MGIIDKVICEDQLNNEKDRDNAIDNFMQASGVPPKVFDFQLKLHMIEFDLLVYDFLLSHIVILLTPVGNCLIYTKSHHIFRVLARFYMLTQ